MSSLHWTTGHRHQVTTGIRGLHGPCATLEVMTTSYTSWAIHRWSLPNCRACRSTTTTIPRRHRSRSSLHSSTFPRHWVTTGSSGLHGSCATREITATSATSGAVRSGACVRRGPLGLGRLQWPLQLPPRHLPRMHMEDCRVVEDVGVHRASQTGEADRQRWRR